MDTVARFNDRAEDYVRYRPSYPADAIAAVLAGLPPPAQLRAADVGAGTGISARLLGGQGVRVVAIEPNVRMRGSAARHPNVAWIAATAEATALRSAAVGLVLCAQSFHWFRPAQVLAEFARILGTHGRLALMWNRHSRVDPFTRAYRQVIVDAGGEGAAEQMEFDPGVVTRSGLFTAPERLSVSNTQRLDRDALIGRTRSSSYAPKTGAESQRLLERLHALHDRHADADGFVTLVYDTDIYRSTTR